MTVEPGFGGQAFMEDMVPKVLEVARAIGSRPVDIQVDGVCYEHSGTTPRFGGISVGYGFEVVRATLDGVASAPPYPACSGSDGGG